MSILENYRKGKKCVTDTYDVLRLVKYPHEIKDILKEMYQYSKNKINKEIERQIIENDSDNSRLLFWYGYKSQCKTYLNKL